MSQNCRRPVANEASYESTALGFVRADKKVSHQEGGRLLVSNFQPEQKNVLCSENQSYQRY